MRALYKISQERFFISFAIIHKISSINLSIPRFITCNIFPVGFLNIKRISGFSSHPPLYIESNSLAQYSTYNSS